jgi:peptidoglycan/LPS O-acetylase OafA/YrhL
MRARTNLGPQEDYCSTSLLARRASLHVNVVFAIAVTVGMGDVIPNSKNESRLGGIDVLRGISVVLVVLHHIHLRFLLNGYDVNDLVSKPLGQVLFWSGYYAVIIFFVISGFLITGLSLRRWGSLGRIRVDEFYAFRVARIFPCLLLLLGILALLHSLDITNFIIKPERASLSRALGAALGLHINWLEGHHGYLPGGWDVLWSLSVEEMFYLAFPLVCIAIRNERVLVALLCALIVVGPFNRIALDGLDPWQNYAYLSCMDAIAFGCLAAIAATNLKIAETSLRWLLGVGTTLVVLMLVFRVSTAAIGLPAAGLNVTALELGVALVLVAFAGGLGAATLSKGTGSSRLVGRCSYEIYLCHMFVVLGAVQLLKQTGQTTAFIGVWYAAMLLGSIGVGVLMSRVYSEPMNGAVREKVLSRKHGCSTNR